MEALAEDLTLALHESSKELQQTVKRHNRKRKGKVRRNSNGLPDEMSLLSVDFPNRSEASAGSDLDSILRGTSVQQNGGLHGLPVHIRNKLSPAIEATTDSEDQCSRIANKLSALTLPANSSFVSGADLESDSVTDLSEERKTTDHARRRRRAKLNASPSIIIGSAPSGRSFTPEHERKMKPRPHGKKKELMDTEAGSDRKCRSQKMESEPADYIPVLNVDTGYYDISSESSLLTSDGAETCDDQAGEADDEQSDFFHEVGGGSTYGIPIKPSVDSGRLSSRGGNSHTPTSEHMHLTGIFQHPFPQVNYSTKLKKTRYGKYGRPIKTGYRRLRTVAKVCQSSSEQSQDCFVTPSHSVSSNSDNNKSPKRRKQLLHNTSSESRSFNLQLPSNISWAMNGEYRLKSPFTTSSSTSLFSNAPSYRSPNHSNYTRRRRRLLSANFFTSKKKSGST